MLKPLLEDPSVLKIGHNIKYDLNVLTRYGIDVTPIDDTMVLSFDLDAGKRNHGMDELALTHLGHSCIAFKDVCGSGKNQLRFNQVELKTATAYAAEDADVTYQLKVILEKILQEKGIEVGNSSKEKEITSILDELEVLKQKLTNLR